MRVWLIGTVHAEDGLANVTRLLAILERIRPEVIFLECPPDALDAYLSGAVNNLESTAVRRFREHQPVTLVPVDLPTPGSAFFRDAKDFSGSIEKRSAEYCRLVDQNSRSVAQHGFPDLNSERCSQRWTDIYSAMREAIEELDDDRLAGLYSMWTNTHELREEAMIGAIDDYSSREPFETGVLLIGAAHRRSILDKSGGARAADSASIEGDLAGFLDDSQR